MAGVGGVKKDLTTSQESTKGREACWGASMAELDRPSKVVGVLESSEGGPARELKRGIGG